MAEEINPRTFEEKQQLFDSLLTEQVAESCNAEDSSILGISLLLSTVFDLFNNSLQKPCPTCTETNERLSLLEGDLLEARNEVKRQNARFKKARRRNLDDEDRIDELKAALARANRQDGRPNRSFSVKSAGDPAKRSRFTPTDSDATDDELPAPPRKRRNVKRGARPRRRNTPDSMDSSGSQSPTLGENESTHQRSPSSAISGASPPKNGPCPAESPRNGFQLATTSPQHVPDTYATQTFAPELLAPPGVIIPETFPVDEFQEEIVPVTPDLPTSNFLKTAQVKRELVSPTELVSKSRSSTRSKKSSCTVGSESTVKKPTPKKKSQRTSREDDELGARIVEAGRRSPAAGANGSGTKASDDFEFATPEKRSPTLSPPRSPVIGRALRPERSRLRLTTGMEGVRANRTDQWVKRTSGGDSTNEQEVVVPPSESSVVPDCSPGKCVRVVGGVRIAQDTTSVSVDDGRKILESGEEVRLEVRCGSKMATLEKKPDLEESVSILSSHSSISSPNRSIDRRVADGWSLKPARSLHERPSNGKDRPLQQTQLGLFVRPKVNDLSTLPEFNGGVRTSQTAKSPGNDRSKRPKKSPPILEEPDVPETSQDCFNRGVGISSTLLPGVERSANLNGSFGGVSQVPKENGSKARIPQKVLPGTQEQNDDNDPEQLIELMNQPEPVLQNGLALRSSEPEGIQTTSNGQGPKQLLAEQFKDLLSDYDKVPERRRDEPTYKYKNDVVRKKSERDKLQGWSCADCKKWWDACPGTEEERQRQMNRCAKHRGKFQPPDTPPGYWDLNFPSTQEMKDRGMMSETINASPRRSKPARRKKLL